MLGVYTKAVMLSALVALSACAPSPKVTTTSMKRDADECDFWIDADDSSRSVLIGNDKETPGCLYVWDMEGKKLFETEPIIMPVGVSVRKGIKLGNREIDVVGTGVRSTNEIKIFEIDPKTRHLIDRTSKRGISSGFTYRTYGFCLYKRPSDGALFAFASDRKVNEIHQIRLQDDGEGNFEGKLVRKFGKGDQKRFVEGMIADDELGYFYCCDERYSILKYWADPAKKDNRLLNKFALDDNIKKDREGLALYLEPQGKGYLIVSSQGNSSFNIYQREGNNAFVKQVKPKGVYYSDGIACTSTPILPKFPKGVFAAHNDTDTNFVLYSWEELMP
ncbi:MAG: phytase [Simkaniaceae bacterium]|nr:phytase [Simkaniaceae bacterium]